MFSLKFQFYPYPNSWGSMNESFEAFFINRNVPLRHKTEKLYHFFSFFKFSLLLIWPNFGFLYSRQVFHTADQFSTRILSTDFTLYPYLISTLTVRIKGGVMNERFWIIWNLKGYEIFNFEIINVKNFCESEVNVCGFYVFQQPYFHRNNFALSKSAVPLGGLDLVITHAHSGILENASSRII